MKIKDCIRLTKNFNILDVECEECGNVERVNVKDGEDLPSCKKCSDGKQIAQQSLFDTLTTKQAS